MYEFTSLHMTHCKSCFGYLHLWPFELPHTNMSVYIYSKFTVYKGIHFFLFLLLK